MTDRQPLARRKSPGRRRRRHAAGRRLSTGRAVRLCRFAHAGLAAGWVAVMICGCSAAPGPDRHPIDGLRMIGHAEPPPARSSGERGEMERVNLHVLGDD
jgi:hypothetical protein